jgi:enoyl-CoA hydratase/carnithine racemase
MDSLLAQVQAVGGAPLFLTGDGDAFSTGLNLKEVLALDAAGLEGFLGKFERLAEALFQYPGPTVACLNGHAIAGGCVLALCCDYRVSLPNPQIRIGLNEVALGVTFPPRTMALVRSRLPNQHANRLLLGAELYPPHEAQAFGLIDDVSADAVELARRRLAELSSRPAASYAATKQVLNALVSEATASEELRRLAAYWANPDVKQRLAAALVRK